MTRMQDRLVSARIQSTKKSVLLLGPRQVGKSTLVKGLHPDVYINLADQGLYVQYSKDPSRIAREITALRKPSLVAIDEVQRVPSLLNSIQALVDDCPIKHRFLLTGSSARKLRRGGANLLPGRVIMETLDPLLFSELPPGGVNLDRALRVGMLPGVYLNEEYGHDLLTSYVETYLREEIISEGLSKNLGAFARLLDVVAVVSGQWLNYSKLSSDVEIPKETVRRYITLLEDTLILHRLESFRPRTKLTRKITQRDRIVLFDVGVRNAILGTSGYPVSPTDRGHIFEQWMLQQVIGLRNALKKPWKITSFLDEYDNEVDIVIETGEKVVGIEVKYGSTIRKDALRGLLACEKVVGSYKQFEKIVAFSGERPLALDHGCRAVPYQLVLEELAELP